jgi:hypothetical protein
MANEREIRYLGYGYAAHGCMGRASANGVGASDLVIRSTLHRSLLGFFRHEGKHILQFYYEVA